MNCSWINALYNGTEKIENCINDSLVLEYPCDNSYVCNPYLITIDRGTYLFEVFGAEGGGPNDNHGKGGGIKAFFSIYSRWSFFAYIGAKGEQGVNMRLPQTFGGGGGSYSYTGAQLVGNGGGASDIRRYRDDLSSRLIVAGGGGGSGQTNEVWVQGTSTGGDGSGADGLSGVTTNKGTPGSGAFTNRVGDKGVKGSFGFGGTPENSDGSGGGGGYYGGNAGCNYAVAGGGGSGFVSKRIHAKYDAFTGVRRGNGLIRITKLVSAYIGITKCLTTRHSIAPFLIN